MMNKTSQIVIAVLVSMATAIGVAYAVVQSRLQEEETPVVKPTVQAPQTQVPATSSPPLAQTEPSVPTEPTRQVEVCQITQARVSDPDAPLNVRSSPTINNSNVVGQLENGSWVLVETEENGWFKINNPVQGWIAQSRTESNCNQKVEQISFPSGSGSVTIEDRFIGTGIHQYVIRANRGQRLTVTTSGEVFPVITSPSNQYLVADPAGEQRQQWTGTLTESGNYTLTVESNFKGYDYAFSAKVE